jgi:hypothetical protein
MRFCMPPPQYAYAPSATAQFRRKKDGSATFFPIKINASAQAGFLDISTQKNNRRPAPAAPIRP